MDTGCQARNTQTKCVLVTWLFVLLCFHSTCGTSLQAGPQTQPLSPEEQAMYSALVNYTYADPTTGTSQSGGGEIGQFGRGGLREARSGRVVHVLSAEGDNHGCTPSINAPASGPWIALVQRGGCKFQDKILISAVLGTATAVVIYNNVDDGELILMNHSGESI